MFLYSQQLVIVFRRSHEINDVKYDPLLGMNAKNATRSRAVQFGSKSRVATVSPWADRFNGFIHPDRFRSDPEGMRIAPLRYAVHEAI